MRELISFITCVPHPSRCRASGHSAKVHHYPRTGRGDGDPPNPIEWRLDPSPLSEHAPLSANDQATPSSDVPRKPRRCWPRFSLRTLLILVTLLSIGLGWF